MSNTEIYILISMILFVGGLVSNRKKNVASAILFMATAVTLFPALYAIVCEL